MSVTSPVALLTVPIIVGAIASGLSSKEIERYFDQSNEFAERKNQYGFGHE